MRSCPRGHRCPEGWPIPCNKGHYNPKIGKYRSNDCLKCPKGFFCSQTGISEKDKYKCPLGHYCDEKATLIPKRCPSGTYRDSYEATSKNDCAPCPKGFFCNAGTITPEPCQPGYYCPAGSSKQIRCTKGNYCDAQSAEQTKCPPGFFCKRDGSNEYQDCPPNTFCPIGSALPFECPSGTKAVMSDEQDDVQKVCEVCPPGTFSKPGSLVCETCSAGYVCTGGSISAYPRQPYGYIANPGFYALAGALVETPCPQGTYTPKEGGRNIEACLPCPKNTFNNKEGAGQCRPCAPGTRAEAGSTTCACIGKYRRYLAIE